MDNGQSCYVVVQPRYGRLDGHAIMRLSGQDAAHAPVMAEAINDNPQFFHSPWEGCHLRILPLDKNTPLSERLRRDEELAESDRWAGSANFYEMYNQPVWQAVRDLRRAINAALKTLRSESVQTSDNSPNAISQPPVVPDSPPAPQSPSGPQRMAAFILDILDATDDAARLRALDAAEQLRALLHGGGTSVAMVNSGEATGFQSKLGNLIEPIDAARRVKPTGSLHATLVNAAVFFDGIARRNHSDQYHAATGARVDRALSTIVSESTEPTNAAAVDAPDPTKNMSDFRTANWIRKATEGGLYADLLAKMADRGQLGEVRKPGGQNLYNVRVVAQKRPQYAECLIDALQERADFRKHRKGEKPGGQGTTK